LIDTKLNITDQRYNDTAYISLVNQSLTNLSRLKYHQENITITTSAGVGGGISTSLVGFLITEIKVTPTSLTSQYKFKATTYAGNVIDQDRATHTGIWDIEKNYAINDKVVVNITNSNPAIETYTININYIDNFRP
jgi:glycerate kinase